MSNWLKICNHQFHQQIFECLWNQWSQLGIAGCCQSQEHRIIDPESLLLFSLSVCRFEPRLFDEIIDWLVKNGHIINVQRLVQIQKKYSFDCNAQLSAIAKILTDKTTYKLKWSGLSKKYQQKPAKPLFIDIDGSPMPHPSLDYAHPDFLDCGLIRGKLNLRGYSQSFDANSHGCVLLKLRALIGINARAEILSLLLSGKEIHPSEAARRIHYYQKTVQTTLVEMSLSSLILVRQFNRKKMYRIKEGVFDGIIKTNSSQYPKWINWAQLFKISEMLMLNISELCKTNIQEPLLSSELKKLMSSLTTKYCDAEGIERLVIEKTIDLEDFPVSFKSKLIELSKLLNNS